MRDMRSSARRDRRPMSSGGVSGNLASNGTYDARKSVTQSVAFIVPLPQSRGRKESHTRERGRVGEGKMGGAAADRMTQMTAPRSGSMQMH